MSVDGRAGDAVSAASQELFNRASLRPDDIANRASPEAAVGLWRRMSYIQSWVGAGKAKARKRLAKAAGDGTNATDADDTAHEARGGVRGMAAGEYERGVRERLAMLCRPHQRRGPLVSRGGRCSDRDGLGLCRESGDSKRLELGRE